YLPLAKLVDYQHLRNIALYLYTWYCNKIDSIPEQIETNKTIYDETYMEETKERHTSTVGGLSLVLLNVCWRLRAISITSPANSFPLHSSFDMTRCCKPIHAII